jgi:hypothetical protein
VWREAGDVGEPWCMVRALRRRVYVDSRRPHQLCVILPRGPVFLHHSVPPIPSTRHAHLRNFPQATIHASSHHLSAPAAAHRFWLGGSDGNGTETDRKNAGARPSLQCCLRLQLSLRTISSWPSLSGVLPRGRHWRRRSSGCGGAPPSGISK